MLRNIFIKIVNCYKGKGDAMERGNYRGLKLLDQVMKAVKWVFEKLVRDSVKIDQMQFGFMPGKGTTEAIFLVRQLQEKYLESKESYTLHLWIWRRLLTGYPEK